MWGVRLSGRLHGQHRPLLLALKQRCGSCFRTLQKADVPGMETVQDRVTAPVDHFVREVYLCLPEDTRKCAGAGALMCGLRCDSGEGIKTKSLHRGP